MICASCHFPFDQLKNVRINDLPDVGSLILCGKCGHVNIICESESKALVTREITEAEFKNLHKDDKNDLFFAIRAVAAQHDKQKSKIILPDWYKPETTKE